MYKEAPFQDSVYVKQKTKSKTQYIFRTKNNLPFSKLLKSSAQRQFSISDVRSIPFTHPILHLKNEE